MPASEDRERVNADTALSARRGQPVERVRMSSEVAVDLVVCGVLLAGLSVLARHVQPDFHRATLFTGLVGGGLCVVWGVRGRRGKYCRRGAMVTLVAMACVFVRQAVLSWNGSTEGGSQNRKVMALMAVLLVFCAGMLANLIREGKKDRSHE